MHGVWSKFQGVLSKFKGCVVIVPVASLEKLVPMHDNVMNILNRLPKTTSDRNPGFLPRVEEAVLWWTGF